MPQTYTPIVSNTLSSGTTTVTFSSIPDTYTDLILQVQATVASGNYGLKIQFNSDTGTNYSNCFLYGTGSAVGSTRNGTTNQINLAYAALLGASSPWISTTHIQSYANTSVNGKIAISRDGGNGANAGTDAIVSLWRSTAAINTITITNTGSGINFSAGSIFTLYGIKAA